LSIDELAAQLQKKGHEIQADSIAELFRQHRIKKN
jgi:hypothetical protein